MIVIVYVICWILVMIIDFVKMVCGGWVFFCGVYIMYFICGLVSVCINFLVYGFMNRVFCVEYMRLLGICMFNILNFLVVLIE